MRAPRSTDTGVHGHAARTRVGQSGVGVVGVIATGTLLALAAGLGLYALWALWPPAATNGTAPASSRFVYFTWHLQLSRDQQLLILVAVAGALGGLLHGLRSLAKYVGERYLFHSWLLYYAVLPLVGAILGTFVYLVLRAGLLGAQNGSQTDPYGIAAIAALVGLFSGQAAEKLKAVFETLFTSPAKGGESVVDVAQLRVTDFDPKTGGPGTVVTITGEGLQSATGVDFGGVPASTFTAATDASLTATVPAGAQTGQIMVHAHDQDASSAQPFTVQ